MSEMTFYIEEVKDGDPPPEPPPDDGEVGGFDPSEFVDMGDLTGQLENLKKDDADEEEEDGDSAASTGDSAASAPGDGGISKGQKKKLAKKKKKTEGSAAASVNVDPMVGAKVEIIGLVARPDLNGCRGIVEGPAKLPRVRSAAKGGVGVAAGGKASSPPVVVVARYPVTLDFGKGTFDLKEANLVVAPPWTATTLILTSPFKQTKPPSYSPSSSSSSSSASTSPPPLQAPVVDVVVAQPLCGRGGAAVASFPLPVSSWTMAEKDDEEDDEDNNGDRASLCTPLLCVIGGADRLGNHFNDVHLLTRTVTAVTTSDDVKTDDATTGSSGSGFTWISPPTPTTTSVGAVSGSTGGSSSGGGSGGEGGGGEGGGEGGSSSSGCGPCCPRSGHSAVAFQAQSSGDGVAKSDGRHHQVNGDGDGSGAVVVVVYGGADLSSGKTFGDLHQLFVTTCAGCPSSNDAKGQEGVVAVEWRSVLPSSSSSSDGGFVPEPRNAHSATAIMIAASVVPPTTCTEQKHGCQATGSEEGGDATTTTMPTTTAPTTVPTMTMVPMMAVFGGSTSSGGADGDGGPVNELLLLSDPSSSSPTWHKVACDGLAPLPREMHSACALQDNSARGGVGVVSGGGSSGGVGASGGGGNSAAVMVVAGGRLASEEVAFDCWLLHLTTDPAAVAAGKASTQTVAAATAEAVKGTWVRLDDLPSPRCGHSISFLPRYSSSSPRGGAGQLVVFGGFDGAAFASGGGLIVLEVSSATTPSSSHVVSATNKGAAAVVEEEKEQGGGSLTSSSFFFSKWVSESAFVSSEKEENRQDLCFERLSHGSAVVVDGKRGGSSSQVVVFGGVSAAADLADVFTLAPPGH